MRVEIPPLANCHRCLCAFFFPFPVLRSQQAISAAPGEWKEASAVVFPLHLAAQTEPWLCQLDLHTGGSLCHPVKRYGGFRVLACNSLRNTETCAFLYNLYLLLYLEKRIGCFSHIHTHTYKYACLGFNTVIIQLR